MIATHSPNMFSGWSRQSAIAANVSVNIPWHIIGSHSTNMRKEFWPAPENTAEMSKWQEAVAALSDDYTADPVLPNIADPQLKQLVIPLDWRNEQYVSISPVASMGVLYEIYNRLAELRLPYWQWVIQRHHSEFAAYHGQALLAQNGTVRLLQRDVSKIPQSAWAGNFIQLTARCENVNISSGMVAAGLPAITAIGGLVHSLERSVSNDIDFAFGLKSSVWNGGARRVIDFSAVVDSKMERIARKRALYARSDFIKDEIIGTSEIVLLLKSTAPAHLLTEALSKITRIAGGILFDAEIAIVENGQPPEASYLVDASNAIINNHINAHDPLQAALMHYGMDGEWINEKWHQSQNGYTLNHTGYAFLEDPQTREGSKNNYPHAWAEPLFSLITQSNMSDNAWWTRNNLDVGVVWQGSLICQ